MHHLHCKMLLLLAQKNLRELLPAHSGSFFVNAFGSSPSPARSFSSGGHLSRGHFGPQEPPGQEMDADQPALAGEENRLLLKRRWGSMGFQKCWMFTLGDFGGVFHCHMLSLHIRLYHHNKLYILYIYIYIYVWFSDFSVCKKTDDQN